VVRRIWSAAADAYLELAAPVAYDEALHGWEARCRRFGGEVLPGDPVPATPKPARLAVVR
jgi:hypothetical protein